MDDLLRALGISYDKLTPDERSTYKEWLGEVSRMAVTVDRVKDHIKMMKYAVEFELSKPDVINNNNDYKKHLLARLQNYVLLEAMMDSPDRAKKQLEAQISMLKK